MHSLSGFLEPFFKSEEDRKKLIKVVIPSFVIQSSAVLLSFLISLLLAKHLGSDQYGTFSFAFSFIYPLVSFASFGISMLMVREIPFIHSQKTPGLLKGLHNWSLKVVVLTCLMLTGIVMLIIKYVPATHSGKYTVPILIACIAIPFYGLMNYYSSALRGLGKIVQSQIADNVIRPGGFLLAILFLYFYTNYFNEYSVIGVSVLSFAVALFFSAILFYKAANIRNIAAKYDTRKWWMGLASLSLYNAILSLDSRIDVLMLGVIKEPSQVGIYTIAHKIALFLYFFLAVMNTVIAPSISRLYGSNQKQKLQEILTKTIRSVMVLSIPAGILIIVFSKWIMAYFGKDFVQGQTALIILCVTQLISISFGSVGIVAIMTGHEKYNSIATVGSIILNILGNLILTPTMGINGTAISAAVSITFWNIFMFIVVKKKVGVSPWIFTIK